MVSNSELPPGTTAQGYVFCTRLGRITNQIQQRLYQQFRISRQLGNAGIILPVYFQARISFGIDQAANMFEHLVNIDDPALRYIVRPQHSINQIPQAVVSYGSLRWLNPGHPDAFDHTMAVIRDLLERYDFDGIHFDDYFYPYPDASLSFDDDATYEQYGGGMSLADWRRDNVNRLVQAVGEAVSDLRPDVRWGIAPFGIYRPGMPPGVVGLDQYAAIVKAGIALTSDGS